MTGRGDGDLIRPSVRTGAPSALPQLPFAGLLRNDPPNGAAAEIPASLLLPQAAAGLFPTGSARPVFPVRGEGFEDAGDRACAGEKKGSEEQG